MSAAQRFTPFSTMRRSGYRATAASSNASWRFPVNATTGRRGPC
jgi:hypothetical protein